MNRLSMIISTACLLAATSLTGCGVTEAYEASKFKPAQMSFDTIRNADYGSKPPANYQDIVKAAISRTLLDPTSPLFTFNGEPEKGFIMESERLGTYESFGWRVCGSVNAKNKFGGYVGDNPFIVIMRGSDVMQIVTGSTSSSDSTAWLRAYGMIEGCSRTIEGVLAQEVIQPETSPSQQ